MKAAILKRLNAGGYSYIFIYWSYNGNTIKINTKNRYYDSKVQSNLLYNYRVDGYKEINAETEKLLNRVNEYITKTLAVNKIPQQRELKDWLRGNVVISGATTLKSEENQPQGNLIPLYKDFIEYKRVQLKSKLSLKDYTSLRFTLEDFEKGRGHTLNLQDVNTQKFLPEFNSFLIDRGLVDNTINKRIQSFKTFIKYLQDEGIYDFKLAATNFKVKKYTPVSIALTLDEVKMIYKLELNEEFKRKIIDLFVMNCFMGLRYSDLEGFKDGEFYEVDNILIYRKVNKKTGIEVEIPIFGLAKEILEKYGFNPPIPAGQYFNRALKDILEEKELFEDDILIRKYVKGEEKLERVKKRKLISSHTCRRTFITNAMSNNIPLNLIQTATGHTQISTLNKYVKKNKDFKQLSRLYV